MLLLLPRLRAGAGAAHHSTTTIESGETPPPPLPMCISKMAINASSPSHTPRASSKPSTPRQPRSEPPSPSPSSRRAPSTRSHLASQPPSSSSDDPYPSTSTSIHYSTSTTLVGSPSLTSRSSLTSLRDSLPETPSIYDISEIRAATNSFLAKTFSSSSSSASWRATLGSKNVVIFQRKLRSASLKTSSHLKNVLSQICRSHHMSIIKLLGACISGEHIYLVYEHVSGANLALCLRNPRNPNFTVLATWMSRMQIATDIAHGLDYIHNNTGLSVSLVHKLIKSTSFIVTEPSFNAKICHFGTAQLCGEIDYMPSFKETDDGPATNAREIEAIVEEEEEEAKRVNRRSDSRRMQFEGTRGYMSPEFQETGIATQKSDVYSFGVVILELLSGEEPLKYKYDKDSGEFRRTAVIETAMEAVEGGEGKVRRWVDKRLRDSFPVDVAEKMIRLGLDCVHAEADQRPNMGRVAGKISKLYLESEKWSDRFKNRGDGSIATLDMSIVGPRE